MFWLLTLTLTLTLTPSQPPQAPVVAIQPTDALEAIRGKLLAMAEVSPAYKTIFTAFANNQRAWSGGAGRRG